MQMVLPMHVIISSEINVECMHDHARHEIQLATMSYKLNVFMRDCACCIMYIYILLWWSLVHDMVFTHAYRTCL